MCACLSVCACVFARVCWRESLWHRNTIRPRTHTHSRARTHTHSHRHPDAIRPPTHTQIHKHTHTHTYTHTHLHTLTHTGTQTPYAQTEAAHANPFPCMTRALWPTSRMPSPKTSGTICVGSSSGWERLVCLTSYALHPIPCTLHLALTPYALRSTPYALRPTSFWHHMRQFLLRFGD